MDFMKSFDARSAAETARPLTLRNQSTGEAILVDGKPAIVLIKGTASRSVQAAIRAELLAKADDAAENATKTAEDLHQQLCQGAKRYIAGFQNIATVGADGQIRALDLSDVDAFLDLNFVSMAHLMRDKAKDNGWLEPSFAQQVLDFAQDDAAFLPVSDAA